MLERKELETIKKQVEIFFQKMSFPVEIVVSFEQDTLSISLKSEEPRILIGEHGKTLAYIQKLLKSILQRKTGKQFYLKLDVNEYRKKKNQYLKEMVKQVADKVSLTKEEVVLDSMSAYERRIVHLELSEREDVETKSIGIEPERRVVIKPAL